MAGALGDGGTIERLEEEHMTQDLAAMIESDFKEWGYDIWLNSLDDSIWNGSRRFTQFDYDMLRLRAKQEGYAERKLLPALSDALVVIAHRNRRGDDDSVGAWIKERCTEDARRYTRAVDLYRSYRIWCENANIKRKSRKAFEEALRHRGYRQDSKFFKSNLSRVFWGLTLTAEA
jgi:hypothetical protein